jgi:hypothetical protein
MTTRNQVVMTGKGLVTLLDIYLYSKSREKPQRLQAPQMSGAKAETAPIFFQTVHADKTRSNHKVCTPY